MGSASLAGVARAQDRRQPQRRDDGSGARQRDGQVTRRGPGPSTRIDDAGDALDIECVTGPLHTSKFTLEARGLRVVVDGAANEVVLERASPAASAGSETKTPGPQPLLRVPLPGPAETRTKLSARPATLRVLIDRTTGNPIVILGTKCPSITST